MRRIGGGHGACVGARHVWAARALLFGGRGRWGMRLATEGRRTGRCACNATSRVRRTCLDLTVPTARQTSTLRLSACFAPLLSCLACMVPACCRIAVAEGANAANQHRRMPNNAVRCAMDFGIQQLYVVRAWRPTGRTASHDTRMRHSVMLAHPSPATHAPPPRKHRRALTIQHAQLYACQSAPWLLPPGVHPPTWSNHQRIR